MKTRVFRADLKVLVVAEERLQAGLVPGSWRTDNHSTVPPARSILLMAPSAATHYAAFQHGTCRPSDVQHRT